MLQAGKRRVVNIKYKDRIKFKLRKRILATNCIWNHKATMNSGGLGACLHVEGIHLREGNNLGEWGDFESPRLFSVKSIFSSLIDDPSDTL